MRNDNQYFLKVSEEILSSNHREFHQTVQFLFNHLQSKCLEKHLSLDVNVIDLYYIYFLWTSKEAIQKFMSSNEFKLLNGALQALGHIEDIHFGGKIDVQFFETDQLNE